jgi:hypothetical protein
MAVAPTGAYRTNVIASFDAADAHAFKLHLPASGRAKLLDHSLVSPAYSVSCDYLVTFGDHIFDSSVQVGAGGFVHGDKLPDFL